MIIICGHMPGQWKNDEMIYVVPGQNIPKKDDIVNVQSVKLFQAFFMRLVISFVGYGIHMNTKIVIKDA